MADARFYTKAGPFSLHQLADIAGATISGAGVGDPVFYDVKPLPEAGPNDVSFIDNRRYVGEFVRSKAGAILMQPDLSERAPSGAAQLITKDPYRGFALIAQAFYPSQPASGAVSATADVSPSAELGEDVAVGAGAVIGSACRIGARTYVGPNTVVGDGVSIGADCRIVASCTLTHCDIGSRVLLHPGVRVGQDGFGFAPGLPLHVKVPQLGRVVIGDDVEIGANSAIDRGSGQDTVIGDGTKIDNLVHIGHNVTIGRGCLITGQVGISGSTKIGDHVMIGGQAGLVGHLTIGSGARIGAQSGVTRDVPAGATVAGSPAADAREHWKTLAFLSRLRKREKGA